MVHIISYKLKNSDNVYSFPTHDDVRKEIKVLRKIKNIDKKSISVEEIEK